MTFNVWLCIAVLIGSGGWLSLSLFSLSFSLLLPHAHLHDLQRVAVHSRAHRLWWVAATLLIYVFFSTIRYVKICIILTCKVQ